MQEDTFYHIYNRANGNENLFRSDENYRFFLKQYAYFIVPVADTFAYCLMPNHFHFLIRIKAKAEIENLQGYKKNLGGDESKLQGFNERYISQQFSNFFNSYTKAYNILFNRKGSLFQPNFKRKAVHSDAYFGKLIHYIHANPVHHGFVKNLEIWPYSSYYTLLHYKKTLLKREYVLDWFYGREEFLNYHRQPIDLKTNFDFD